MFQAKILVNVCSERADKICMMEYKHLGAASKDHKLDIHAYRIHKIITITNMIY